MFLIMYLTHFDDQEYQGTKLRVAYLNLIQASAVMLAGSIQAVINIVLTKISLKTSIEAITDESETM